MLRGCLGGVEVNFIKRLPRWGRIKLHSAIGRGSRINAERLPRWGAHVFKKNLYRWGQTIVASVGVVASVGCLGGVNPKNLKNT